MAGDIVWGLGVDESQFVQGMNRARQSAKQTKDEIQRYAEQIRNANMTPQGRIYDDNSKLIDRKSVV